MLFLTVQTTQIQHLYGQRDQFMPSEIEREQETASLNRVYVCTKYAGK
jgi:hypothetical protein